MDIIQLVEIRNGQPMTTSRLVAWKFGKRHGDVTRSVKNLECSEEFNQRNFAPVGYKDKKGELRTEYAITKDGFAFLVMGFTGSRAARFKEEYINEFNRKDMMIKEQPFEVRLLSIMQELQTKVEQQEKRWELASPKVEYHDKVLQSSKTYTTTFIAKELGMSAVKLNKKLHEKKIQYKQDGVWLLYSQYQDRDYTDTYTHLLEHEQGTLTYSSTKWTEKGRNFIHSLFPTKLF